MKLFDSILRFFTSSFLGNILAILLLIVVTFSAVVGIIALSFASERRNSSDQAQIRPINPVDVHSGHGLNFPVISVLPRRKSIDILGITEDGWYLVVLQDGRSGWIAKNTDVLESGKVEIIQPTETALSQTPTNSLTSQAPNTPYPKGQTVTRNDDWTPIIETIGGVEMVLVPAGCFLMGNDEGPNNEQPAHMQCLDEAFWMGRYEVTNAEYARFIRGGGYTNPDYWTNTSWNWRRGVNLTQPGFWNDSDFNAPQYPVVGVSWYEAYAYTQWLKATTEIDFCLPSEAEWEYTARGPDSLIYPWGNDGFFYTSRGMQAEAGFNRRDISWVGAMDMSGNVREWTRSNWGDYPYSPRLEQVDNRSTRAMRGSFWTNLREATHRNPSPPNIKTSFYGFRVCAAYTSP